LAWMGFIFFASTGSFSGDNTSRFIGPLLRWLFPSFSEEKIAFAHAIVRKLGHFSEYAVLALLAARAFNTSAVTALRRNWFWVSLGLVVLYALSDEYHQSFVPTRGPSVYDSLIDMAGGLTALLLYALWRRRKAARGAEARV
jgi:VanZ family protein